MDQEKEVKFLSKRQRKRIIHKHVNELLEELKYNQADFNNCILSQPSSAHSTTQGSSNIYLDSNVNLNTAKNQYQNNEIRDEELLNETFNTEETSENIYNTISEIIQVPDNEELDINEESYSSHEHIPHKTLSNTLENRLRHWSLTHNITLSALNDLLSLLKEFHPDILLSGRSLLYTPRTTKSINLQNGQFTYFGICRNLNHLLENESQSKLYT